MDLRGASNDMGFNMRMDHLERYLCNGTITNGVNDYLLDISDYIEQMVYDAHVAGAESTKGIGLNLSKEERADQYCKDKGLRI